MLSRAQLNSKTGRNIRAISPHFHFTRKVGGEGLCKIMIIVYDSDSYAFFSNNFLSHSNAKIINACKRNRVSSLVVSGPMISSLLSHPILFFCLWKFNLYRFKYNKAVTLRRYPNLLRLSSAVCILIFISQKLVCW